MLDIALGTKKPCYDFPFLLIRNLKFNFIWIRKYILHEVIYGKNILMVIVSNQKKKIVFVNDKSLTNLHRSLL